MSYLTANATLTADVTQFHSPDLQVFSKHAIISIWVIMGVIWIFGFFAHLASLVVISRMKRTPLNVFIMGLCCSDIISAIVSPMQVRVILNRADDYPWNILICKTLFPLTTVTSAVTIEIVLVLSMWRLYAIHRPHKASRMMTVKRAKVIVASLWLIVGLPLMIFGAMLLDVTPSRQTEFKVCLFQPSLMLQSYVFLTVETVGLNLVPISAITIMCVAIGLSLLKRKEQRATTSSDQDFRKEEKRALIQVTAIVMSFLVGYLPKAARRGYGLFAVIGYRSHTIIFVITRAILNLTESINPILYVVGSSTIAKAAREELDQILALCRSANKAPHEPKSDKSTSNKVQYDESPV